MPEPIEINVPDTVSVQTNTAIESTKTSNLFDETLYGLSYMGDAGVDGLEANGYDSGAEILSAAVNQAASTSSSSLSSLSYSSGSGLSTGSGLSSLSYGSSLSASTGDTDDLTTMAYEQLAETQASSLVMLMLQNESSNQQRIFTTASNMAASRDNLLASMIRNVRGAL